MATVVALREGDDEDFAAPLGEVLAASGLWQRLPRTGRILLKVDLAGFRVGDPAATNPQLVEALIDLLRVRSEAEIMVAASVDDSAGWAGNRDVFALAELLGYAFTTPGGHDYDLIDLGAVTVDGRFGGVLVGTPASADWLAANFRIVVASLNHTPRTGWTGALDSLIGVLPLADKALHYRHRRDAGAVVAEVLRIAPPQFVLLDGGRVGTAAPRLLVASRDAALADHAAALRLGLDPWSSAVFAGVIAARPLAVARYDGALTVIAGAATPAPVAGRAAAHRGETVDRLLQPWLAATDAALFPHARPLDARVHAALDAAFANSGSTAWRSALFDGIAAAAGQGLAAWRTLFDKDALVRRVVPLGIDADAVPLADFDAAVARLKALEPLAESAPERGPGLRWRRVNGAVVFAYTRDLAVPFEAFVAAVDVARTIEYMNDYLGGVVVPLARDAQGRSVRQAERNLYLPQPNWLVLYGGQPIDVTKIEVVEYAARRHRLYWQTIRSENGSAAVDDGIATFAATRGGTRVTITGRQQFTLPLFWQMVDVSLWPDVETALTTHSYQTFFDRTLSNFEALCEGRDIRLGQPIDTPTPLPGAAVEAQLARAAEAAGPWLERWRQRMPARADADGFVHGGAA